MVTQRHHRKIAIKTAAMAEGDMEIKAAGQAPMERKRHTHRNLFRG
jgi:hypothetical protein